MKNSFYLLLVAILFIAAACSNGSKYVGIVYVEELSEGLLVYDPSDSVSLPHLTPAVDTVMIDGEMVIEETIYNIVEEWAEFPGGTKAFYEWIEKEIKYPSASLKEGSQGVALMTFTIDKDGSVTDVMVVKSTNDMHLDKEAKRVIKSMPKWKPFKQAGKPVKCMFTLPIRFKVRPLDYVEPLDNKEVTTASTDDCKMTEMQKALNGDTLRASILAVEPDEYKSKCRNIFQINVNMRYQVLALYDGGTIEIDTTAIKDNLKRFLLNAENESTLPEYEEVELPLLGTRKVITRNNRIVFKYCDSVTEVNENVAKFHYLPIDSFAKIRPYYVEQIFAAYNEVRDEFAQKEFGKSFDACSDEQKNVCRLAYPCLVVDDYKAVSSVPTPPEAKKITDMLEIVDDEELKNLETIVIEPQKLTAADKERNANMIVTLKKCR